MHASGFFSVINCRKWPPATDYYLQEGMELAQSCVSLVCKGLLNICLHKFLFSSCFPAGTSTGASITVKNMLEFISMNNFHKLPDSWRKHWVIMPCLPSSQGPSFKLLALEERGMSCGLHCSPCVPNGAAGSARLRGAPGDTVCCFSGTSLIFLEMLTSWCILVAYSARMHHIA